MIDNIQALRAVAALLVVFVHLDVFASTLGLPSVGHGGVDLFFVISGFIMVHTTRGRSIGPAAFMRNRITRIVPIYWLLTLAVYGVALAAPSLLQATSSDPEQLAKSLAFVPFRKANGLVQPVLFVGWTLEFEMFFYALFALGLTCRDRARGIVAVSLALGALVLLGLVLQPENVVAEFYTRPIILEFAAGMGLAMMGDRLACSTALGRGVAGALCALGLLAVVLLPLAWPDLSRVVTQGCAATLVVGGAVALHRGGVRWSNRWLRLLGDASYSLYLTHPFVTQAAQKAGRALGLTPAVAAIGMVLALLMVCVTGVVTYAWVERPLTELVKRHVARWLAARDKPEAAPGYARVD